ncbi:MAG: hypothetical protein V3575_00785 [Candidatus Absconditabacteria bacterium]
MNNDKENQVNFESHLNGIQEHIINCIHKGQINEANANIEKIIVMCKNLTQKLCDESSKGEVCKVNFDPNYNGNEEQTHSIYFENEGLFRKANIEISIKNFLNNIYENYNDFLFDKIFFIKVTSNEIKPIYFFSIFADSIQHRLKNIEDFKKRFKDNITECGEGFLRQEIDEGEGAISKGNGSKCVDLIFKMKDYIVCFKYSEGNINDIEIKTGLDHEQLLKLIYTMYKEISVKL